MMEASEVKKFFSSFTDEQAKLVADLCNGEIQIDPYDVDERFPKTAKWCRQCHNPPSQNELVMAALDDVIDGFGVEAIRDPDDSSEVIAEYVNTGDTYSGTVVYDHDSEEFTLSTWGDWYETWEGKENEENETITCGYCSHRTPNNQEQWHDVICESCGNYVDGKSGPVKTSTEDEDDDEDGDE